ncbi:helix-turn-helix transcriptional regulator [Pseudomonas sp. S 311-6]|nr:helix-turn-helix transcriptional regulator [Pseudomonas sp. S 311-6]
MTTLFHKPDVTGNPDTYRPQLPFDDMLRMIRLSGVIHASVRLAAPWGYDLPHEKDAALIYFVLSGSCIVHDYTATGHLTLSAGDALLVPLPVRHAMADSADTPLVPMDNVVPARLKIANSANDFLAGLFQSDTTMNNARGATTWIITLRMYLDRFFPIAMLKSMPRLLVLPGFFARQQRFISQILDQLVEHGRQGFSGQAIATRLTESIFTAAVQQHLDNISRRTIGPAAGWNDPVMSKVLGAIYQAPGDDWSVTALAAKAGLSRSAFLKRFTHITGQSPHKFITSLRMMHAMEMLEHSEASLLQIATRIGYGSEAAFSRAFQRWACMTPGSARRRKQDEHERLCTHKAER